MTLFLMGSAGFAEVKAQKKTGNSFTGLLYFFANNNYIVASLALTSSSQSTLWSEL